MTLPAAAAWAQYYAQQGYTQYQILPPAVPPPYAAPVAPAPPAPQPQQWAGPQWPSVPAPAPADPAWQYQMQTQPHQVVQAPAPVMPAIAQPGPPPPPPRRPTPPSYAPPAGAPPQQPQPPPGQPGAPAQQAQLPQQPAPSQQVHSHPQQQQMASPLQQHAQGPEQQYMRPQGPPQDQQHPLQQQYMQDPQQYQQLPEQHAQAEQQHQQQQHELMMQQQLLRQQQQQLLEQQALLLQQKQQALEQQKMLFAQQQQQLMQQQWSTMSEEQRRVHQQQQYMQALQEQWGGAYELLASLPEVPEEEQDAEQQAWQQQAWQEQQQQGQEGLIGPQLPPGAQQPQEYAEGMQPGQEQGYLYPDSAQGGVYSEPAGPAGPPIVSVPLGPEAAPLASPAVPLMAALDLRLLLLPPGRATRPRRVLLVLRGLSGSGKSTLARCIRELETKHGGQAPRVHSIDDYFMTEVEKELDDVPPAGAPAGGRTRKRKAVETEYQYDAAMEDTYAKSLVKAVGRTLEEAAFSLVVVDAPCPRAEQVRELWAMGQHAGYEGFAVLPLETNPEVCHQRNIHGRKLDELLTAAAAFETLPASLPVADGSQLLAEWWSTRDMSDMADAAQQTPPEGGLGADAAAMGPPSARGGDAEGAGAASASRWAGLDDKGEGEDASKGPASKKARRGDDRDAADVAEPSQQSDLGVGLVGRSGSGKASALKKAGASDDGSGLVSSSVERRRVRWPDQEEAQPEEGFRIAAPLRQLEEVFVVAGLGPNADQDASGKAKAGIEQKKSFLQAVQAEHMSEHNAFRALLLGKSTAGAGSSRSAALTAD